MEDHQIHEQPSAQARLQLARNIARSLNSANNAIALYPPESPMPREAAAGFVAIVERFLMLEPYLQLSVSSDSLCLEDDDICGTSGSVRRFAFHLHSRQVGQIRFLPGIDADESVQFLRILGTDAEALRSKGGLGKALVAGGVQHVTVVDLAQEAAAVSGSSAADATEVAGVSALREEALISNDPTGAREWLAGASEAISAQGFGRAEKSVELAKILSVEVEEAFAYEGADRELGLDNLTDAVTSLDEPSRRGLIGELMTSADTASAALNTLLSRIDESELVAALSELATASGTNPAELLDTTPLDDEKRDRVAGKASAVVRMAAAERARQQAEPAQPVALPDLPRGRVDESLPRYARRGDDVPFSAMRLATDVRQFTQQERDALLEVPQEAAARELDKPMIALLYLLNRSQDPDASRETIESIVDTAAYALNEGRVSTVTRGICGIRLVLETVDPGSDYGHSLEGALARLSGVDVARKVALLLDGDGEPARAHEATTYFMNAQPTAQEAAVEVLGSDVSPELRKRIQGMLKDLGPRATGVLERHVTDKRWIVAHSSVVILGGIGEPRVVPALRRAMSYNEPRVAEAAMRALAGIGGQEAESAIVSAVEHGSETARALAIGLLGKAKSPGAVDALARVVAAGDLFGRSLGEKLAAVAALAGIGTAEAARALEGASRTRFFFSPGKTKQLRAGIAEALVRMGSPAGAPHEVGEVS